MLINQHRYRTVQTAGQSRLSNNKAVKNTQSLSYTGRFQSCFPPSSVLTITACYTAGPVVGHYIKTSCSGTLCQNGTYRRVAACLPTVAEALTFALQSLHAAAAASGNTYWRPTLAIVCSPLDAGHTNIMIDRHDRPTADFRDTERPPLDKNYLRLSQNFLNNGPGIM